MIENTLRPTVKILHTLARSGGTVVGKCLGSMDGVVLLSEIHPAVIANLSLIEQANKWHHLFSPEDIQWLMQEGAVEFREAVAMINERCTEQGKTLVIRDWSYIDFIGVPYRSQPCFRLKIADVLKKQFSIAHTSLVRHPIDQWLSLKGLVRMENVTLEMFLQGYFRFAEYCADIGFTRYEDFTRNPENQLNVLCDRLDLNFDPEFRDRWANYTNITGDIYGAGRGENEIKPLPRREMKPGLLEMFEENADYLRSLELLGYEHPELDRITDDSPYRHDRNAGHAKEINQRGEELFARGDLQGALKAFITSIEIDPGFATPHNNLGVLYWQAGEHSKTAMHFAKALEIDPENRSTILNCANVFRGLQEYQEVKDACLSYLEKNPNDKEIATAVDNLGID